MCGVGRRCVFSDGAAEVYFKDLWRGGEEETGERQAEERGTGVGEVGWGGGRVVVGNWSQREREDRYRERDAGKRGIDDD